jgi:tetratricopeptide (TPR) repeat protein
MSRVTFFLGALAAALLIAVPVSGQRNSGGGKMQVPVQKSGKVMMEDGSPLPEPVLVEAACGRGIATPIARTDSKGGFIVGKGRNSDVDARVQTSGGAATGSLAGCSLEARLPGYQSSQLRVVDNEAFDLGVIVLRRPAGVEGSLYSATALRAPKDAKRALEKGVAALEKKKWDEARTQLEQAVASYTEYAAAWFELGRVYQATGEAAKARSAYEQSIKADQKFVKPYFQLMGVLYQQKDFNGAADVSSKLLKLDPYGFPGAYVLNAASNLRLERVEAAEASARQAIKMDGARDFPEVEYTLGIALAARGEYQEAMEHLRSFLTLAPNSPGADAVKAQLVSMEQALKEKAPAGRPAQ